MKKLVFDKCRNKEDIRNTILTALGNECVVFSDEDAEQWFKDAEMDGDVHHNVIVSENVSVWNEEMDGEESYQVIVKEHYIDSGSDDYVYSFNVIDL